MAVDRDVGGFGVAHPSRMRLSMTRAENDAAAIENEPAAHGHAPYAPPEHGADPLAMAFSAMEALARIPFAGTEILCEVKRLVRLAELDTAPDVWVNSADVSDQAPAALGALFTLPVFATYTRTSGVVLRNVQVSGAGAAVVKLVKSKGADNAALLAGQPYTVLGTIRLDATILTQAFGGAIILSMGEQLHLLSSTAVNLDFSCDYRYLRTNE